MKISILKNAAPFVAAVAAVMGAFASQDAPASKTALSDGKLITLQTGYVDAPSPCTVQVSCRQEIGDACTMFWNGSLRNATGKHNVGDATCPKILYKP